jgi:hypothetical protein
MTMKKSIRVYLLLHPFTSTNERAPAQPMQHAYSRIHLLVMQTASNPARTFCDVDETDVLVVDTNQTFPLAMIDTLKPKRAAAVDA